MKRFFGCKFIEREKLKQEGIYYPIKLEYYKTVDDNRNYNEFGIKVIKTEYRDTETKIEEKEINRISNDEDEINKILEMLKSNEVSPVSVQEILYDFFGKKLEKYRDLG